MKNLLKKFGVMIASLMLVMSTFAMPSFAAEEDTFVTISGVEKNATVMAYQVVKDVKGKWTLVNSSKAIGDTDASKNLAGGIKTTEVAGSEKTDVIPTAAAVAAIADNPSPLTGVKLDWDEDTSTYKSSTEADKKLAKGVYVVVVTGTSNTIYNPMVVSMDYDDTNNSATVSAGSDFVVGSTKAYAKKSTPDVKKTTLDNQNRYAANPNPFTTNYDSANDPANDRNVGTDMGGSILPYKVVTKIPSYAQTFTNPKFYFTDKLNNGFDGYVIDSEHTLTVLEATTEGAYKPLNFGTDYWFVDANKVKIEGDAAKAASYINKKQTFSIEFDVENDKPARDICITYSAKMVDVYQKDSKGEYVTDANGNKVVKEEYRAGVDPYTNDVKIEWSKNPSKEDEYGTAEDCTHHYTFDIDGSIGGNDNGKEIIKVAVDNAGNLVTAEKELPGNWKALAGAQFAIYQANDDMTAIKTGASALQTVTTESDGTMDFKGLDAGKYVIKEVKAPDGYALNETLIPVEIVASFKEIAHHGKTCHVIDKYTVTINKRYTNTYTAQYDDDGELTGVQKGNNSASIEMNAERAKANLAVQDNPGFTAGFVNTKTGTLPSTGGMGTILFTVGGIVIMALALILLFGSRKKQHQK